MRLIIGVALLIGVCPVAGQDAPPAPLQPDAVDRGSASLDALTPKFRAFVAKRAKNCLRLPDGTLADVTLYYQLHEAIADCVTRSTTHVERRSGNFVEQVPTESHWTVRRSPEGLLWGINLDTRGATGRPQTYARSLLVTQHAPMAREFEAPRFAVEWSARGEYPSGFSFLFIDAEKPDTLTKQRDVRGVAAVVRRFEGDQVEVSLQSPAYAECDSLVVQMPPNQPVRQGFLPGRFVLWPDPSLVHPLTGRSAFQAAEESHPGRRLEPAVFWEVQGSPDYRLSAEAVAALKNKQAAVSTAPDKCVYRYIPAPALSVAPADLVSAIDSGAVLRDWSIEPRADGRPVWVQKRLKPLSK